MTEAKAHTHADRIRELLEIDSGITKILESAGLAVQALTRPTGSGLEDSKELFQRRANEYVLASQAVAARLRRQIYALEEAGIVAPTRAAAEPTPRAGATATAQQSMMTVGRPGAPGAAVQKSAASTPMQVTNGGLGKFDVGWLNSRIDRVGPQKEAELWARARAHLEGYVGGAAREDDVEMGHD